MDKREQILAATAAVIAEYGLESCPMAKIAKAANVGAGTIYRYFATKEVLIEELHAFLAQEIPQHCLTDYNVKLGVRQRFDHMWGRFYEFMRQNNEKLRLLEQLQASPALCSAAREETLRSIHSETLALFDEAKSSGVIKDLPNELLATVTFGSLFNIAKKQQQCPHLDLKPQVQDLLDLCWDAIAKRQ